MKRKFLNIFIISFVITTMGLVMDGDPTEPSMKMRFVEFFAMLGIVFSINSLVYFSISILLKNFTSKIKQNTN